jgi:hypothetical protein
MSPTADHADPQLTIVTLDIEPGRVIARRSVQGEIPPAEKLLSRVADIGCGRGVTDNDGQRRNSD